MLKKITVSCDDLLLDPNNPRFVRDLKEMSAIPDENVEKKQEEVLKRFSTTSVTDRELDVTNIKDLYESMKNIGFVEIDRVVVRQLKSNGKFLVVEGNRRISTVKNLLREYDDQIITEPKERRKIESFIESFRNIKCMLLETEGLSQKEIDHRISVIIGIRHHGSLLEWEPLPKAYNIYTEYMSEEPETKDFELDGKKVKEVSSRLSIDFSDVKRALRVYIAYLQLCRRYPVKDWHYSLIEAGITNKHLSGSYFKADGVTFRLNEESLEKMDTLCQFSIRDSVPMPEGKKKIVPKPQTLKLLGRLVDKRQKAKDEAIKNYATDLIRRAEDEDDTDMTLEGAVDDLTDFENRKKWAESIGMLLDKQEAELRIEDYRGSGNDRGNKDELKATLEPLRKIMGI